MSDRTEQRIIGLTGGISTGKTTVSSYLATTHHLPVLDADTYAREAVSVGSPILQKVTEHYGAAILLPNGTLDRPQLGTIIFNNPAERQWLEQQIHPYVRDRLLAESRIQNPKFPIVLAIPLLFEANMSDLVTEIWVVYCKSSQQIERLMKRDRLTLEQAQARINSQMPIQEKCDRADVILDNSCTPEHLIQQIDGALGGDRGNIVV